MIKIIVDIYGGDKSPDVNIEGAVLALNQIDDLFIVFAGDENIIKSKLQNYTFDSNRMSIINAPDEITCNDKPTDAIKTKTNSSLYQALELLRKNDDINAMVTAGSSGAVIAGAIMRIGRIKGVKRPAFCPILPTMNGGQIAICDSGANVDCDSLNLEQFAIMSNLYMKHVLGIPNPRVALLNVGVEAEKGDMLRKEVYPKLEANKQINFVGNMESRDLLKGNYDVVVCDGFAGNVLLKSTEGACLEMLKMLKKAFYKNLKNKIGALLLKKDIYKTKEFMDYNNYSGAVLLGCAKTIVKAHGSSNEITILRSIERAYNMEKNNLRDKIASAITQETIGE